MTGKYDAIITFKAPGELVKLIDAWCTYLKMRRSTFIRRAIEDYCQKLAIAYPMTALEVQKLAGTRKNGTAIKVIKE